MFNLNDELNYFKSVIEREEEEQGRAGVKADILSGDRITDIMDVLGTLRYGRLQAADSAAKGEQISLEGLR